MRSRFEARQIAGKKGHARGHLAEFMACALLVAKGYRIRAVRYRTHAGEIDIVASRKHTCVCVEVKARPNRETGLYAVRLKQQQRIEQAALLFLQQHPYLQERALRFDVITLSPRSLPKHLKDAWRPQ